MPVISNGFEYQDTSGRRYGMGLIRSSESERRSFCRRSTVTARPRASWVECSMLEWIPKVYNQGQQGSCVGHGGVGSLATLRAIMGLGTERLSACNLYGQINRGVDQGALVIDALKALKDGPGVCLESSVGPTKWQPNTWPSGWKEEAARFKIEDAEEITGFDEIATALLEGDPVCFGIPTGGRFEPRGDGTIPDWDGNQAGGHCMYHVGLKQMSGKWFLETVNSWGESWGLNGICYLPESYFRSWHEAYRIRVPKDDPKGDNPPEVK